VFTSISMIYGAFGRHGYNNLLCMMVMGDQIVPQEHRKAEYKENGYVPVGLHNSFELGTTNISKSKHNPKPYLLP
jgi:hypothetical protein